MTPPAKPLGQVKVDGSVGAEAQVKPQPAAAPAAEAKPEDKPHHPLFLTFDAAVLFGGIGYDSSYVFPGGYGKFGDFNAYRAAAGLLYQPTKPDAAVDFRFGGKVGVQRVDGNVNVDGGTESAGLWALSLIPNAELDWGKHTQTGKFRWVPRIGLDIGLGYGWGKLPPQGFISQHAQEGFNLYFAPYLSVVEYKPTKTFSASLDFRAQTEVVDGKKNNSAFNWMGPQLTIRGDVFGKETVKVTETKEVKTCNNDLLNIEELRAAFAKLKLEIQGDGTEANPGLVAKVKVAQDKVDAKKEWYETREKDPLSVEGVRDVIRSIYVSQQVDTQVKAQKLDRKKTEDAAKIKEIEAQAIDAAKEKYPDSYNFWIPTPEKVDESKLAIPTIPSADKLPTDCEELGKYYRELKVQWETVNKAKQDLTDKLTDLERIEKTPIERTKTIITEIKRTVEPNLKKVHFENDRPNDADLTKLRKAIAANKKENGGKINWSDKKLQDILIPIFDKDTKGTKYLPEVLKTVGETAKLLHDGPMKEVKGMIVEGHTSLAGDAGHNKKLSERRAHIIREMIIAEGQTLDPNSDLDKRLGAKGYGEDRPLHPDEEKAPKGSTERANMAAENRRIELYIPETELERVEAQGAYVPEALGGKKKKKKAEGDGKKDDKKVDEKKDDKKPEGKKDEKKPDEKKKDDKKPPKDDGIK